MCVAAMPMLTFALSAASAVVGYMGQMQSYKAQQQQYMENARAAQEAARNRYKAIQNTLRSEQRKSTNESMDASKDALKARSSARVAAGEAGVAGLSVNALLSDFASQEEAYLGRIDQNYDTVFMSYEDEKTGAFDTARARINSVSQPVKPSFLGAAVQIGQAGVQLYGQRVQSRA
jgi:hypothetical protein